jgi:hypothetical protein
MTRYEWRVDARATVVEHLHYAAIGSSLEELKMNQCGKYD